MKLRAPAVPLITIDPYFSVWSPADSLTDKVPVHWTSRPNTIFGTAVIDGENYLFMGKDPYGTKALRQVSLDISALSTVYVFEGAGIRLTARFTSPVMADDLYYLSRPVSYLQLSMEETDGKKHSVQVRIDASEELCMNFRGLHELETRTLFMETEKGVAASVCLGRAQQKPLSKDGDDIRIDWGYFYLSVLGGSVKTQRLPFAFWEAQDPDDMPYESRMHGSDLFMTFAEAEKTLTVQEAALFTFSYDDIESIVYFGDHLKSWWNKDGARLEDEIVRAMLEYDSLMEKASAFDRKLAADAEKAGGKEYREILELAYRQVIAAHKLAVTKEGEIVFISKECFSNGCAATVDVSYPSIPLFLLYNPELVAGMMRPIYRYARSKVWVEDNHFDFAPHDAGRYPFVNGQVYGANLLDSQMPVEECGNMIVMAAAQAIAADDLSFAKENLDLLEGWADYLIRYGRDPENQLCTDDFAGHLAHNCNLSLKAISGLIGLSLIEKRLGCPEKEDLYLQEAKAMVASFVEHAANGDGSYRLAYDQSGTFSMKYNIIWDKVFGTDLMPREVLDSETASYWEKMNPYGLPLDNRATYTKSDWEVWTASLYRTKEEFERFIHPLWMNYHFSESRVPLTDWYWTITARMRGFRHRSVQGGLFMKVLDESGIMKRWQE